MFINIAVGELKEYIKHRQEDLKYKLSALNPSSWWSSKTNEENLLKPDQNLLKPDQNLPESDQNLLTPDKIKDQIKNPLLQELLSDEARKTFTNKTTDQKKLDSYCRAILAIAKVEDLSSAQKCIQELETIEEKSRLRHNKVELLERALINIMNRTKEMNQSFLKELTQKVDKFWNESLQIKSLLSPEMKKQLNEYVEARELDLQKKSSEDDSSQKSESPSDHDVKGEDVDDKTQKKEGPPVIHPVKVGDVTIRMWKDVKLLHTIVNKLPVSVIIHEKIAALALLDPSSYEQLIKQITVNAPGNDNASQPKRALPKVPNSAVIKSAPGKDNPSQAERTSLQNSSSGSDDPGAKLAAILQARKP